MWFLIEYDRPLQATVTFRTFADSERKAAEDERLRLEVALARRGGLLDGFRGTRGGREVVLLEAASEEALRRTHGRYFDGLKRAERIEPRDLFKRARQIEQEGGDDAPSEVIGRRYRELMLEFGLMKPRQSGDPDTLPCGWPLRRQGQEEK
jgi:hypothetical protein